MKEYVHLDAEQQPELYRVRAICNVCVIVCACVCVS